MKFDNVVQEAVVLDKTEHYKKFSPLYYMDGRKKHVKENVEIHIVNFAVKKIKGETKIIPAYVWRKSIYKPIKGNKEKDELFVSKRNIDLKYSEDQDEAKWKEFEDFKDFHQFQMREYRKGNLWPNKLMEEIIRDGWSELQKTQSKYMSRDKKLINYLDTIASQYDRLEEAVKYIIRKRGLNSLQKFVVVRKHGKYETKERFGERVNSNAQRHYRDVTRSLKLVA